MLFLLGNVSAEEGISRSADRDQGFPIALDLRVPLLDLSFKNENSIGITKKRPVTSGRVSAGLRGQIRRF